MPEGIINICHAYTHVHVVLASFPGLRGGGEARPGTDCARMCAHVRNYCEIYVREQWACTQNILINCTCVFEIREEVYIYTVVQRSSGERKEKRH